MAFGVRLLFDEHLTNLTGIVSKETILHNGNLYISAVIHKAFVDVNEEGTEAAAAATAVMMGIRPTIAISLPPPVLFRADHPFLFLIRDNNSGGILFMGRVIDPTK